MKIYVGLALLFLLLPSVQAASLGISPGTITLDNLLRGGYAERVVTITTNAEEPTPVLFSVEGPARDWVQTIPNGTLTVSQDSPASLRIIVQPPADAQIDSYDSSVRFVLQPEPDDIEGRAGGFVQPAVIARLLLSLTGQQIVECRAGGFSVSDTEIGFPLQIRSTIINDGNTRLNPTATIQIWDQTQEVLIRTDSLSGDMVLPTVEDEITYVLTTQGLSVGQYWADIQIEECGAGNVLTFSVVEPGQLADRGLLHSLNNKNVAEVDEPVVVTAQFENVGQRAVSAQFKGTVRIGETIIDVIETEPITVSADTRQDIEFIYTPEAPGRHLISGRVHYNNKITFERGSVLNVRPKTESAFDAIVPYLSLGLYVIIAITIFFLIRLIILGKRKRY